MDNYVIKHYAQAYGSKYGSVQGVYGPYVASSPLEALALCKKEYDFAGLADGDFFAIGRAG